MKIVLILDFGVSWQEIIVLAFVALGLLIPNEKSFTQETEINASPETVWKVLNDRKSYPVWQDKLESVEIKDDKTWIEVTKDAGPIDFKIVRSEKPQLLELHYSTQSGVAGEWIGELKAVSKSKTIVTTRDKSIVNSWIAKIFMSMFFDIEDFAKDWNKKLKARAESLEKDVPTGEENQ